VIKIDIRDNFPQVKAYIASVGKQARFAAAVALTRTAQDVRDAERKEMQRAFDRPTPYTLNSLFLKPAKPGDLNAQVWIKDDRAGSGIPATRYLLPEIEGGARSIKRFEKALQLAGAMPTGWFAVPGQGARLDGYGNVSAGQIIQILSQLRITLTAGYNRNVSLDPKKRALAQRRAGGQYFALPNGRGRLVPGIYQARDFAFGRAAPKPVFIFVRRITYRRRFQFFEVAQRTVDSNFAGHFSEEFSKALRSAR
jgi:hypothetical protein